MIENFDWQQLIWLDYLLLAVLLAVFVVGVYKGLVKEAVSFVFWPLSIWLSFNYYEALSQIDMLSAIEWAGLRYTLSFTTIFLATLLIGKLIAKIITAILGTAGLGVFNRFFGGVFAAIKGAFIVVAVFILLEKTSALDSVVSTLKQGHLSQFIDEGAQWLKPKLAQAPAADDININIDDVLDNNENSVEEIGQ